MLWQKFAHSLKFKDDLPIAYHIGTKLLSHRITLIGYGYVFLRFKRDAMVAQLYFKCFLVYALQKSCSKIFVYLVYRATYNKRFFFKNKFVFHFRVFRGLSIPYIPQFYMNLLSQVLSHTGRMRAGPQGFRNSGVT